MTKYIYCFSNYDDSLYYTSETYIDPAILQKLVRDRSDDFSQHLKEENKIWSTLDISLEEKNAIINKMADDFYSRKSLTEIIEKDYGMKPVVPDFIIDVDIGGL